MRKHEVFGRRLLFFVVLGSSACAGDAAEPPGPPASVVPQSSGRVAVPVGTLLPDSLRIIVRDERRRGVPNVEVTWSVGPYGLAKIRPAISVTDSRGFARAALEGGRRPGEGTVTASVVTINGPAEAVYALQVLPGAAAELRLSRSVLQMGAGTTQRLDATVFDSFGNPIENPSVAWSSSKMSIVEVGSTGLVTAKMVGTATITASLDSIKQVAVVIVGAEAIKDDFDTENDARFQFSYTGFRNWRVTRGSVDLIGANSEYDFVPGHGLYVDLDGYYSGAKFETRSALQLSPGSYTLSFSLAGSQRGDTNTVHVSLGSMFSESITLPSAAKFTAYTRRIVVSEPISAQLVFDHEGRDGYGLLLDDVVLARQ